MPPARLTRVGRGEGTHRSTWRCERSGAAAAPRPPHNARRASARCMVAPATAPDPYPARATACATPHPHAPCAARVGATPLSCPARAAVRREHVRRHTQTVVVAITTTTTSNLTCIDFAAGWLPHPAPLSRPTCRRMRPHRASPGLWKGCLFPAPTPVRAPMHATPCTPANCASACGLRAWATRLADVGATGLSDCLLMALSWNAPDQTTG